MTMLSEYQSLTRELEEAVLAGDSDREESILAKMDHVWFRMPKAERDQCSVASPAD